MTSGGQCVMTTGTALMQQWCANSWDMQWPSVMLTLVLALAQFSWTLLVAKAVKTILLIVHIALLVVVGVTPTMLE